MMLPFMSESLRKMLRQSREIGAVQGVAAEEDVGGEGRPRAAGAVDVEVLVEVHLQVLTRFKLNGQSYN